MSCRYLGAWLALAIVLSSSAPRAETPPPPAVAAVSVTEKLGAQLPLSARFRSSAGRELSLGSVLGNGKPTLLVLAYNRCTMLCNLVLRGVADLIRDFAWTPGEEFSLVTISIDPRDTAHEAARLQAALLDSAGFPGQPERWTFLVGEKPEIDAVADQLGFRYAWDEATQQYAHPAVIFAISRSGAVAGYFQGISPEPEQVLAALQGRGSGTAPAQLASAILNCFRFEAASSRYGATIAWLFRLGAASVCLAVVVLVGWLMRQERAKPTRRQS